LERQKPLPLDAINARRFTQVLMRVFVPQVDFGLLISVRPFDACVRMLGKLLVADNEMHPNIQNHICGGFIDMFR
jgi:hypothetical protein